MLIVNQNVGKWIQVGGGVLLIGFAVLITGCGSATTSMAGGASNPKVSIVNANKEDIDFFKNIDGKYKFDGLGGSSASATSVTHTSSVGRIMTAGTVGMVFNSPKLTEFIASKGLSTFAYIQHQYNTNRGFTGWYGDQNEYLGANQSIYYRKTAPTNAESCTTCYQTQYSNGTYQLNEEQHPTSSSVSISEYSINGGNILGKILYCELKQLGYTLSLTQNGTYTVSISTGGTTPLTILTFGPFLLEKNSQKYVLVNKTTLPRMIADNLIVTMEIQDMSGQIIGEADVVGSGQINFKVYVNGVLTSVNSLN